MKSATALHTLIAPGKGRASYGFDRHDLRMRRTRRPAHALRQAIDCMPFETRLAMREALEVNPIIAGAYTDRDGGVCPMLAAHRNGGRTSFAAFARAWDRYTHARRSRPATPREVRALAAMLDASIAAYEAGTDSDLLSAISAHRSARASRLEQAGPVAAPAPARRRDSDERDRGGELARRHGWAWLRPFRRLDEYERALEELGERRPASREGSHQPA